MSTASSSTLSTHSGGGGGGGGGGRDDGDGVGTMFRVNDATAARPVVIAATTHLLRALTSTPYVELIVALWSRHASSTYGDGHNGNGGVIEHLTSALGVLVDTPFALQIASDHVRVFATTSRHDRFTSAAYAIPIDVLQPLERVCVATVLSNHRHFFSRMYDTATMSTAPVYSRFTLDTAVEEAFDRRRVVTVYVSMLLNQAARYGRLPPVRAMLLGVIGHMVQQRSTELNRYESARVARTHTFSTEQRADMITKQAGALELMRLDTFVRHFVSHPLEVFEQLEAAR